MTFLSRFQSDRVTLEGVRSDRKCDQCHIFSGLFGDNLFKFGNFLFHKCYCTRDCNTYFSRLQAKKCMSVMFFLKYARNIVKKRLEFVKWVWYIDGEKYGQRRCDRNGRRGQAQSLTREWGKAKTKAPHWPIPCAFRAKSVGESQSLGQPEKAGLSLVWGASRETYCDRQSII